MSETPVIFPILCFCAVGMMGIVALAVIVTSIRMVPENKRLKVFRLGQFIGERGPGLVFLMPLIDRGALVDVNDPAAKL